MKRIFVWTLPLLLLLGACKDQDEPAAHVAGSILAGETGAGIRSMTFSNPIQIDGASISNNKYEVHLDSSLNQSIIFRTGKSSGWGYNHGTCAVNTSSLAIELAGAQMNDTLWKCEEWAVDSSEQHRYYYNRAIGTTCQNSSTIESVVTVVYPIPYNAGDNVGSALAWRTDWLEMAFYHSDVTVTSDGNRSYVNDIKRRFDLWVGAPRYVAFRWKSTGGVWKYGYVLVEVVGHWTMKIHGYGMEA